MGKSNNNKSIVTKQKLTGNKGKPQKLFPKNKFWNKIDIEYNKLYYNNRR